MMDLDAFRQWKKIYEMALNPNDPEDDCPVHGVRLYTTGGWPEGHYGPDDPGVEPEWETLDDHLWFEMMYILNEENELTLRDTEFKEAAFSYINMRMESIKISWADRIDSIQKRIAEHEDLHRDED